jgi:nucleotide-binding universal stress UspA family protein
MIIKKILIAVDFSEPSAISARWVARHFAANAHIVLGHVVDLPQPPLFLRGRLPPHSELVNTALRGAEQRLEEFAASLGAPSISWQVRAGSTAEQLLAIADETGVDMIAVGQHGRRRGIWNILGSTAERLLDAARVPVLLAGNLPEDAPRIVLAPVASPEVAVAVLRTAKSVADQFGASVMPVHVFDPLLYGRVQLVTAREGGGELQLSAEQWLRERVEEAGIDLAEAKPLVLLGSPGYEILSAASRHGAGMIVMGSRASGIGRALLGSVARSVVRGASCPVLVLRGERPTQEAK